MKRKLEIMLSIFAFSVAVTFVDAVIHPNYFVKILIKILFFLALPILFFLINKDDFKDFKKLFVFKKKGILTSFLLGLGIYAIILLGYFLTREFIDFSKVTSNLSSGMGITSSNFVYVSLYISLMNSFLEEFFFRGFGFITLKKYTSRSLCFCPCLIFHHFVKCCCHILFSAVFFDNLYHHVMMPICPALYIPVLICKAFFQCFYQPINASHWTSICSMRS